MAVLGHLHSANVIQIAWMAIFPHFSIDFEQISLQATVLSEETKGRTGYCLRKFYSGTGYHFQEFDSGTGKLFKISGGTSPYVRRPSTPPPRGKNIFRCHFGLNVFSKKEEKHNIFKQQVENLTRRGVLKSSPKSKSPPGGLMEQPWLIEIAISINHGATEPRLSIGALFSM